ncbi:MAG: hypothetical protein LBQ58_03295, partial [Synergistaceae bacterium]|nr:hypothetical protein [Synergistaceae bacterium]
LITRYVQRYNVVTGSKGIFSMYPVDGTGLVMSPHDLTLNHPSVFGLRLAQQDAAIDYFTVTGFELLASDPDFLKKAASTLGRRSAAMPTPEQGVMANAVSAGFVTADAISTISVNTRVPAPMMISEDVAGLLPMHVTFNLPRSNRYIAPRWNTLLNEWKTSGSITNLFSNMFSLYIHDASGYEINVTNWLRDRGILPRALKVFADEVNGCVTVSFIVMITDSDGTDLTLVDDKSSMSGTDNSYLVVRDGNRNDMWDMTFFVAPTDSTSSGGSPGGDQQSGGGGGGCDAGVPLFVALLSAVGLYLLKAMRTR